MGHIFICVCLFVCPVAPSERSTRCQRTNARVVTARTCRANSLVWRALLICAVDTRTGPLAV
eukprot:3323687-Pyramimonas_sp.AAC.1